MPDHDADRREPELGNMSQAAAYDAGVTAGAEAAALGIASWLRAHVGKHSLAGLYVELAEEIDGGCWKTPEYAETTRGAHTRRPGAWRGQVNVPKDFDEEGDGQP